jgi:hypothetical protein
MKKGLKLGNPLRGLERVSEKMYFKGAFVPLDYKGFNIQ